mgnify:CR=1 FL=1
MRLIEAYSLLRQSHPEGKLPQLVLAGKRGWLDNEIMRAAQSGDVGADIRFTGYIADEDFEFTLQRLPLVLFIRRTSKASARRFSKP